jgi:copper chaperone
MIKEKMNVEGMHCKSCEMLIRGELEEKDVKVSFKGKELTVEFDENKISLNDIKEIIKKEGYKVE